MDRDVAIGVKSFGLGPFESDAVPPLVVSSELCCLSSKLRIWPPPLVACFGVILLVCEDFILF